MRMHKRKTETERNEQYLLERIPLPGDPTGERDRKAKWLALPRRARIAIRRLHRNFRHLPRNALLQMLRAARVPKEYIDAAKVHKCDVCTATKPPAPLKKVSPPKPYTFNHEVGVDVLEIKDAAGTFYAASRYRACWREQWSAEQFQLPRVLPQRMGEMPWMAEICRS